MNQIFMPGMGRLAYAEQQGFKIRPEILPMPRCRN
jgi:hypothetical protein